MRPAPGSSGAATMSRREAAAYVGLSPHTFDREVKAGTLPPPLALASRRRLWSRAALDRAIDPGKHGTPADAIGAAIEAYDPR